MKRNKDLIILLILTIVITVFLISINAFEKISIFFITHEEYQLDEIASGLLVLSIFTLWYSARRYLEIVKIYKCIESSNIVLSNENIKKDNLLLNQSKMALLGEMLENIAHQWRQPLSVISIGASGIKIKEEYGNLDRKELVEIVDNILVNTKYLSDTIENFKHFINEDELAVLFCPDNYIKKSLNILKGSFSISNITHIEDLNSNQEIYNHPNGLMQVLINILTNAKDAFVINDIKERYIFISSYIINDNLHIKIKDNAKGIPTRVITKIFEPYFTTKHKSNGTGLGLYMSYKIITEKMNGEISIENVTFSYNKKTYTGAEFNIIVPINK